MFINLNRQLSNDWNNIIKNCIQHKESDKWKNIKNKDLWLQLQDLVKDKTISWHWVKGHSENILNNRVDILARNEAKKL